MSRLDDLIADLCPDGVPYQALGDIAEYSPDKVSAAGLDETTFVGVDNMLPNKAGRVDATYSANTAVATEFRPGYILLGNIRPYLQKVWLSDRHGGCGGDVLVVRVRDRFQGIADPTFLYYVLSSDGFFDYNQSHARGAKMPRGDKRKIMEYPVQLPPLDVQREIVRLLNPFIQLEAELEAELEARRQQFAYYLDRLMAFDGEARWATIGEACSSVFSGGTPKVTNATFYGGDIPWLRTHEVNYREVLSTSTSISEAGLRSSAAKWVPPNSVIIAISGAGVTRGRVAINRIPVTTNQHCCALVPDRSVITEKFLYYWLVRSYGDIRSQGRGNRSDLTLGIVEKYQVPVPPLDEQRRIADILDRFDTLVNDLSIGLPAEIAARRQQYEHYRDRLLALPERT